MLKKMIIFAAVAGLVFALAPAAQATIVTVPTDRQGGGQYRLVFVTSGTTNATSTAIGTYNSYVAGAAALVPDLVALGTTWTAIASTAGMDAITNTGTSGAGVPIYRLDGERVADDYAALWAANVTPLLNSISVSELGGSPGAGETFTGTGVNGLKNAGYECGAASMVRRGNSGSTSSSWVYFDTMPPNNNKSLYAMSGVLEIPEPATAALLLLGLPFVMRRRRRS